MEAIVTRADEVRNSTPIGRFMDTPMEANGQSPGRLGGHWCFVAINY